MNGSNADGPSSSTVPVFAPARTPKYVPKKDLITIQDLYAEQGSLGSQGSVDLPVDSGQARLLELGKLLLMHPSYSKYAFNQLFRELYEILWHQRSRV
jgi:hypothetical protein